MDRKDKKERTEDLNPRSDAIEEKVRRMMDLSVPDDPVASEQPVAPKLDNKKQDSIQIIPSAPELPDNKEPQKADNKNEVSIRKIKITDHNETPDEVAKQLDKAIAGLGPEIPETSDSKILKAQPQEKTVKIESPENPVDLTKTEPDEMEVLDESDEATDKAVDDIIASESDEILEIEDAVRDTDEPLEPVKPEHKEHEPKTNPLAKLKKLLLKPAVARLLIFVFIISLLTAGAYPKTRYVLLNTVGVRANSNLLILDESTSQPLKNVQIKIGSVTGSTDVEGKAKLKNIKLGPATLTVEKRGFAPVTRSLTIGLGSNPIDDVKLQPTGSLYTFTVTDFLSGKPINKIEASSGIASAISDDKGVISLVIDQQSDASIPVTIKGENYREEILNINPDDKSDHPVKLVAAKKHVFVSKRSGKFDIYSIYIDGKDETLVLAGSGNERDDMVLIPHPSNDIAAYVSTRGNQHNSDGYLLSNLILINTTDNTTTNIAMSEQLQVIDWSGDNLVYVQIAAGSSTDSPNRFRLISYNFRDGTSKELAHANYFNDIVCVRGEIYYSPSSAYQTKNSEFYKIKPSGADKKTIFNKEVWNIIRTNYDNVVLSVQQQWYSYGLGENAPTKLNSAPADQVARIYTDSPDAKNSIWSEVRDGKGTLLLYDTQNKSDRILRNQSGLGYPIRWLNDTSIIFRISTDQEVSDYVVSILGGDPVKIRDVTSTRGVENWYH